MLQITPEAKDHLARVRRERGFDETTAPRFVRNGERVGLTFSSHPDPNDDHVLDPSGLPVYMEPDVARALDNSIIDARSEDGKVVLVVREQGAEARRSD